MILNDLGEYSAEQYQSSRQKARRNVPASSGFHLPLRLYKGRTYPVRETLAAAGPRRATLGTKKLLAPGSCMGHFTAIDIHQTPKEFEARHPRGGRTMKSQLAAPGNTLESTTIPLDAFALHQRRAPGRCNTGKRERETLCTWG